MQGGVELPGLPPAGDAEALQHGLRQGAAEVGDLGEGRRPGHAGGEHDRQQRGPRVALAAPAARVGHAFEEVAQGEHLVVGELQTGPPGEPLGTGDGRGQLLPGVAPQGVHEDALGMAVRDIAARAADLEPVGGAVAGAGEAPGDQRNFRRGQRGGLPEELRSDMDVGNVDKHSHDSDEGHLQLPGGLV